MNMTHDCFVNQVFDGLTDMPIATMQKTQGEENNQFKLVNAERARIEQGQ